MRSTKPIRKNLLSLNRRSSTFCYLLLLCGSIVCNLIIVAILLNGVQRTIR